jgi:hypothetical protein
VPWYSPNPTTVDEGMLGQMAQSYVDQRHMPGDVRHSCPCPFQPFQLK